MKKFERVKFLIERNADSGIKILDIGCRRKGLGPFVEHMGVYHGADLFQTGTVEYVGDFTKGLPIADCEYDVVTALDVVEHTEDMTLALDEIVRVCKQFAIVILPNHAHWSFRLRYLFTGRVGDKWNISYPLNLDRHRWLTTAASSNIYMKDYCKDRQLNLEVIDSGIGLVAPYVEKTLGKISPNFWNKNQLYIIRR